MQTKTQSNNDKKKKQMNKLRSRQPCNLFQGLTSKERKRSQHKLGKRQSQSYYQLEWMNVPRNIFV